MLEIRVSHDVLALAVAAAAVWLLLRGNPPPPKAAQRPAARDEAIRLVA